MFCNPILATLTSVLFCSSAFAEKTYDLVIYGGSSAGIAAAVQVKKMGGSVVIIEPTQRIGGLTTGGLGQTDIGNKQVIGGISRNFYQDVKEWYRDPKVWTAMPQPEGNFKGDGQTITEAHEETQWSFEPSAALAIYQRWVKENDIEIVFGERLDRSGEGKAIDRGDGFWVAKPGTVGKGVVKESNRIAALVMESERKFVGKTFMDATYEGDLMAVAGVSFTVGREGTAVYGETLNGVQTDKSTHHQIVEGVDPYVKPGDPASGLLFGIDPKGPGKELASDRRIQAYCFRMCLTNYNTNRIPFVKPAGYDESRYELLFRNYEAGAAGVPWINSKMPNMKTDTNNCEGVSTDFIGRNYDWPQASYDERVAIRAEHLAWQQGLMWSLSNHPRVPEKVRAEVSQWGMTKDEFPEGGGWQDQLYVREGRRMISDVVMTQAYCEQKKWANDSVGMGAYNMDSHNVQRYVTKSGQARNEGNVEVPVRPYPISYKSIVPREKECANLLVPIALSSSHIAFGSIRMEPVFMILGQSGATAAMIAIKDGKSLQTIDYAKLRERLLADKQVLEHESSKPGPTQSPPH
ncbi:MAG: FAD-dependent oxidoreductase [Luteolibacter sp.]